MIHVFHKPITEDLDVKGASCCEFQDPINRLFKIVAFAIWGMCCIFNDFNAFKGEDPLAR